MDVVLMAIAGISLALVVAMGAVLFRLFREERQRSDARVALLIAQSLEPDAAPGAAQPVDEPVSVAAAGELFAAPEHASPWRQRIAIAAVLAACVAGLGYVVSTIAGGGTPPAVTRALPLELLTLGHTQEPDALVIAGIVQNPRTGAPVAQVTAVVLAFDAEGRQLGTAQSPLDYRTLAPGAESPFSVRIPGAAAASRYRVGFRGPDGGAIAHVDRRLDATSARTTSRPEHGPWVE